MGKKGVLGEYYLKSFLTESLEGKDSDKPLVEEGDIPAPPQNQW